MRYPSLDAFLSGQRAALSDGPVAVILAEDEIELGATLRHHLKLGFQTVLALMPDAFTLDDGLRSQVHRIACDFAEPGAAVTAVNRLIGAMRPGVWLYWGFNAEYLYYPFCETRQAGEMLAFHTEERRDAMFCYVIDLYAPDLAANPNGVDRKTAQFDRSGYFAQARPDPVTGFPLERQLDIFGGLRWRYASFLPEPRQRIDRIALMRIGKGLRLLPDHTCNLAEMNTYSCEWHNNLTAAVASFRAAKALVSNPGSARDIATLTAPNSEPFAWTSRQLLDLGIIETGQWF